MCVSVCVCVRTEERSVFSVKRRRIGTVRLSECFREPEQRRAEPVRILRATDRHLIRAEAGGRWSRLGWLHGAERRGAALRGMCAHNGRGRAGTERDAAEEQC